jgi:hypothetical protein
VVVGEGLGAWEGGWVVPPPAGVALVGPGFAEGDALGWADAEAEPLDDEADGFVWGGVWRCPAVAVGIGSSLGADWSVAIAEAPDDEPPLRGVALFASEPPPATAKPVATITSAPTPPSSIPRRRRAARAR